MEVKAAHPDLPRGKATIRTKPNLCKMVIKT
jgi:hypothetical protein